MIKKYKSKMAIRNAGEFREALAGTGTHIPFDETIDAELFRAPLSISGKTIPNRFCIQPMEGCDGDDKGRPTDLTFRKYRRFAAGGAGMIWVEATAVVQEGRANPRQLWINKDSLESFKRLAGEIRANARNEKGEKQDTFLVLQLTHSGRYSKPEGKAKPMIMHHSPVLDPTHNLPADYPLVTDEYLDELIQKFVEAAGYAKECGYDAVDIKSCHGYLLHEMLSAFTRENSRYGGGYENRTRFFTETIKKVQESVPGLIITSRLSIADGYAYPYGWGMKAGGGSEPDLAEPKKLISKLSELGVGMLNICIGNPYYNPNYERPYDFPIQGFDLPAEHPLVTLERNVSLTSEIALAFPGMTFVTTGTSWLRQMTLNVGSHILRSGKGQIIGLGRMALAYPDFANDFFKNGYLGMGKVCITCSSCTQMMRDGMVSGCVIRDADTYAAIYYQGRLKNTEYVKDMADSCRNCWGGSCGPNCPADIDVAGFIREFYNDNTKKAYEIMTAKNKIPETCSYTCPAEMLCERTCTAGILGKNSVPISEIQKFIATKAREEGWTKIKAGKPIGKKAAIIGFGAAGISCAVTLIEAGVSAVIYEAADYAGGTAEAVIPYYRLPRDIFKKEVESLGLSETGLFEIHYNTPLNAGFTLDDIMKSGYDAVFIGAGMCKTASMGLEPRPEGVYDAMDFLYKNKTGALRLDEKITAAVIGGGNTAMDAVSSLKDKGVGNVYLIYRRSFNELPAWKEEIRHAMEMGVHFMILSQPVAYEGGSKLKGVRIAHTMLGEPDDSGRARPVVIPDSEYVLPVDLCVEATGQKVPVELIENLQGVVFRKGIIQVDENMMTSRDGVFAGGDIISGGTTVVQAAGEGRKAAEAIIRRFNEGGKAE
ncbi:MAG: FAD-dependent oxidoreductase [Clostridia bacterium]|nr:FAD-dependent oxidoreductase [Clostridia bacterium]